MEIPNTKQYKEEIKKWKEAGSPLRAPERIKEIFNTKCVPCEHSIKIIGSVRQCEICTCMLRPKGNHLNKIALATTRCPLTIEEHGEEPKWIEEPIQIEEPPVEQIAQQEVIIPRQKQPPRGGCGCGG